MCGSECQDDAHELCTHPTFALLSFLQRTCYSCFHCFRKHIYLREIYLSFSDVVLPSLDRAFLLVYNHTFNKFIINKILNYSWAASCSMSAITLSLSSSRSSFRFILAT
jgi:hypothetical protein